MANEKRLIMTEQDAIVAAEQELNVCRYIAECTRNPGMLAIHRKRCEWISVIIRLAKKALKANAVEVVHGRWVEHRPNVYECTACNTWYGNYGGCEEWAYCPNCGAKMDGDGNGATKD